MSISVKNLEIIKKDVGLTLDADRRFMKASKNEPVELLTKTLEDCKNPLQTYDRQIQLFDYVIRFLRVNRASPDDKSDLVLTRAIKVYRFITERMGDQNTQERRWALAAALLEHREKHLDPKSIRPELGRKHAESVSSTKGRLEEKLVFPESVEAAKRGQPPAGDREQKTSSSGVPSARDKGHGRTRSRTGGAEEIPKPKSSASPAKEIVSPRKSVSTPRSPQISLSGASSPAIVDLRQKLLQSEEKHKSFILSLEKTILIGLQGYWRGDAKERFEGILLDQKGYPSYKKLDKIKKIPLMRLVLQTECSRMLCALPDKTNGWALDLIRQSFNIGHTGEMLFPSDVPAGLTQEQLADKAFAKAFLKEKFEKQTRAFERVLKGVLDQQPFLQFREKILEAWESSRKSITKYDDDSAADCCDTFLQKLFITGETKEQKKIEPTNTLLARILRSFRQDFYVAVTTEIRTFFNKKTDYERGDDEKYAYFYSFKADGTVEIDATCRIACQTESLSFEVVIHNLLHSHVEKLDSTWDSCMNFTIESVVPRDSSLVSKPGTIPQLLETTILKPLLQLGFPAEARLSSIQVERLGES